MGHHALKLQGPGLASPAREADSVRARSEEIAARALDSVLAAHHAAGEDGASNRETARRLHLSDVYLRDLRDGDRAIPVWLVLALPPARVGALSAQLDAALADGALTDAERGALASGLRQIAARCEQAARDLGGV